jgi:hypothetical protein
MRNHRDHELRHTRGWARQILRAKLIAMLRGTGDPPGSPKHSATASPIRTRESCHRNSRVSLTGVQSSALNFGRPPRGLIQFSVLPQRAKASHSPTDLPVRLFCNQPVKPLLKKYSAFPKSQISLYQPRPAPERATMLGSSPAIARPQGWR